MDEIQTTRMKERNGVGAVLRSVALLNAQESALLRAMAEGSANVRLWRLVSRSEKTVRSAQSHQSQIKEQLRMNQSFMRNGARWANASARVYRPRHPHLLCARSAIDRFACCRLHQPA